MKRYKNALSVIGGKAHLGVWGFLFMFCSCRETWTKGTTDTFYQGCTEEAQKWAGSPERAKTYCDCVFEKMKSKYPHEEDALAHIDSLAIDPDLIKCRDEVMNSGK